MKMGFIICKCFSEESNEINKYIITFIASLSVALIIFFANVLWDKRKRNKETKERLRREIFLLIEKIITSAIHAGKAALEARYYYAMHKIDKDEDFDKSNYSKYINDCESSNLNALMYRTELISKIMELETHWDNAEDIKKIKSLLEKEGNSLINNHSGIYNETMNKDQIEQIRDSRRQSIENYVKNESIGKNIIEIQHVLYPNSKIFYP